MTEIFKEIEGYEGLYEISDEGNVRNKITGKILKPDTNIKEYSRFSLYKNGKIKKYLIHRLVAKAFIPNIDNKPCIDHIDDNPRNNNVSNLRWVSYQENNEKEHHRKELSKSNTGHKHSEETKRKMSESVKNRGWRRGNNPSAKEICEYDLNMNLIRTWDCITSAADYYNISISNISRVLNGHSKTSYNRIWRFK